MTTAQLDKPVPANRTREHLSRIGKLGHAAMQQKLREEKMELLALREEVHNLALQQALGRLAEVVHSGRGFLDVWGAQCTPVNFLIQVILKDKDGHEVSHGVTLKELVASVAPCGESYAGQIDNLVLRTLRNVSWTLACVTQEAAQLHAQLEGELFKDTREAEAIAKSSGDSEWSVG